MTNSKAIKKIIYVLSISLLIPGCKSHEIAREPANYYYQNPNKKISDMGRIAIVELQNDSSYPQMSNDITEALFQSLQKKQVFGLTMVRQRDPLWKSLQLEPDATYTLDQMAAIRQTLKCDGVLIGTITEFKPYPHMAAGLRLKLIDLTQGELLWALEQVWNSSDKITEQKIKKYLNETKSSSLKNSNERITSMSPLEFIKYVSFEVAQTL
ncbi:MAG: hypothetical protein JW787_14680 [Sedimentisphaerales bacterium]|nr:hypothetical protein [Sedimentisphaerales bacterium]